MRTQAHRIVDTDPKRGNVVVRVTGTRHDEPTYQVRQSLPNTQEVPGHDHHTNRVRETGSGSHGPILRSVPTNRLSQHLDRSSGSRHRDEVRMSASMSRDPLAGPGGRSPGRCCCGAVMAPGDVVNLAG